MTTPQEDAELRDAIKDRFVAQNIHTVVLQGDLRDGQPCNYEIPFDQFANFIKARDEQREKLYAHSRHAYSPYVDTFTFWDECLNTIDSKNLRSYTATKEVRWSTDEDGEVMRLEIKDLHLGALTNPQEQDKEEE